MGQEQVSKQNPPRKGAQPLDFKSATLYAIRVVLHEADTSALLDALAKRMNDAGAFFEDEPVVVDASRIESPVDWPTLIEALREHSLHPVGVVATGEQREAAVAAGLPAVELGGAPTRPAAAPAPEHEVPAAAVIPEKATNSTPAAEAPSEQAAASQPAPTLAEPAPAAMIVNRPLRSGQRVYARSTDLIVIGMVSRGAEVIADGNIHVYGPMRGKAMAGARGDSNARIFTTELDPELVAIAGVYRVIETGLEPALKNKPAIISLSGESLQIESLGN
ncbi:septum site-determining protein MinC [Achromobacter sp. F4_2707]|uniref:septum site-determining protein MinC n=1 Tax=Achromobacter sp. F4_2707 TaxID=3114286 RepID=UPI0039C62029